MPDFSSSKALSLGETSSGGTRKFYVGASKGQKSKNVPKMADFDHFLLTGGQVGEEPLMGGEL